MELEQFIKFIVLHAIVDTTKEDVLIGFPVNKEKPDKYDVLNYRPVSILNAFSKIYEKVIKNQIMSYFDK